MGLEVNQQLEADPGQPVKGQKAGVARAAPKVRVPVRCLGVVNIAPGVSDDQERARREGHREAMA